MRYSVLTLGAVAASAGITAGAWSLASAPRDWKVAGPFGGTATTIAIDSRNTQTVLAGAMNSLLYQSSDAGASWALLDFPKHNLGEVTSILVDPGNSAHYIVGALDAWGGGLYESVDSGKTWVPNDAFKNVGVRALAVASAAPSEFVAGTAKNGVELSTDSGKTWKRVSDPNNFEMQGITAVAIDPKDANIIYAGTAHLPWRSTDAGKTWESIHSGMIDDSDVFSIYVDPKSPETVYASACSGIYQSSSRGDSWRKLAGIPNTSRRTHVIREDPARDGTIFAGTTMGLFRSANGGMNWKVLTPTQVNAMAFDPAQPNEVYLAMEDGVGKSLDGGDTIKLDDNGFVDRQISSITRAGDKLVAIEMQEGATSGVFTSSDQGASWTHLEESRSLAGVHLQTIAGSAKDGRTILAATGQQIYRTADGGLIWHPIVFHLARKEQIQVPANRSQRNAKSHPATTRTRVLIRTIQPGDINGLFAGRTEGKDWIAAATSSGLYFTEDFGEQWSRADMNNASSVIALYASPSGDGRMIAKAVDALYSSKDGGQHWERLEFPLPMSDVNNLALSGDSGAPILVGTRLGVYSSADGSAWVANSGGLQATVSGVTYQGRGRTAYITEYGELYKSEDGGATWTRVPTEFRNLPIRQLWVPDADATRLYAITSGLGILFRE